MRYYQLGDRNTHRLVAVDEDHVYDLTDAKPKLESFRDLARAADIADVTIDKIAERVADDATECSVDDVRRHRREPVIADEVWAAGVTYRISEEAREEESDMPEMYLNVYDADRPEIFMKATPDRTVGPDEAVGIRGDSVWNVPEPELGVVLYDGNIVGYTIGNDMSSRSIEGENPLYLPQAKVYDRCCSIGPCVTTDVDDPHSLSMSMSIYRGDECIYKDETSTAEMVRSCEELVDYLTRHNSIPELTVLLTGTSLVPDDDFTLEPDDTVEIEIEGVGTLTNPVMTV
jgi:2-dehydro-3-deoxy-D-arabinonate dehydratase